MSNWNKLEESLSLLQTISDNTTGSGGGGPSTSSDITHLGGNAIALNTGTTNSGTLRICTAQNDVSQEKRNSTFYTCGLMGGYCRQIVNAAYIPFAGDGLTTTDPVAFKPPFDDLHIVPANSMHDDQAGDSARSVLFEYYDSNNEFQSVTELLGANTTFENVRRVVTFKVVTWGATNKYNYANIFLLNLAGDNVIATIPTFFNTQQRFQQEIPLNGKIYLENISAASLDTTNADEHIWLRIVVRRYDGTNLYDQIIWTGGVPYFTSQRYDVSYLPAINGPGDYDTENISVLLVGTEEGGASATTYGVATLTYKMAN